MSPEATAPRVAPPGAQGKSESDAPGAYDAQVRIATWNVNSVTARADRLCQWIDRVQPDVLALQELKCTDAAFPRERLEGAGYEVATWGTGRWNGVAVISRVGLTRITVGLDSAPDFEGEVEPRAIAATCGGVRVWSVYVPNGREVSHPHYQYKLAWLDRLTETIRAEIASDPDRPLAVIGDFNIAPTDDDVWDIGVFTDATHVTEAERRRLTDLANIGLTERIPRALKGAPFTFWDYRNGAFHRGWGMRIDLVVANAAFRTAIRDCYVDRDERKGKGSSDHAPVVIDLEVGTLEVGMVDA